MTMDDERPQPLQGTVEPLDPHTQDEPPAAVLWVPDPEARRGWREFYVRRAPDSKTRAWGFR